MKDSPEIPSVSEVPAELFDQGHLWIYEYVAGVQLRFRLTEYDTLEIGDSRRIYDPDEIPPSHQHTVRHIHERLDREALRAAVEDVEDIVFFGQATIQHGVPYEWERLPSFLGFDIWHAGRDRFLSSDTVKNIYRRLGLHPLNTVAQEVNVRDFDPEGYEFPASDWYDGPVAGIVIKNKRGGSARRDNPTAKVQGDELDLPEAPAALAQHLATDRRLSRIVNDIEMQGQPVTFDAVRDRLFETIVREEYQRLFEGSQRVDVELFRASLGNIVGEFLAG